MTTDEMYQEFNILYNNIMSNQAPGLDEYEISVFLTMAQEEIIRNYYNGKLTGEGFENTEELRRALDSLVKTEICSENNSFTNKLTNNSYIYNLPDKLWFTTYESVKYNEVIGCSNFNAEVVPVTQDEFHRIIKNPFKGITDKRVLRLDCGDNIVELISKYTVKEYLIRYIEKPSPIILIDLQNGLSIDNETIKTPCKLDSSLHRTIVSSAVRLAISVYTNPTKN